MKRVILSIGVLVFAVPLLAGAQTVPSLTTEVCPARPTVGSCPEGMDRVVSYSSPECGTYFKCVDGKTKADIPTSTSCAMPVNPTAASDWTTTITCILNRISDIENRLL